MTVPYALQGSGRRVAVVGMLGAVWLVVTWISQPLAVFAHCPPTRGVLATFGVQLGGLDRIANAGLIIDIGRPCKHIGRHLKERMNKAKGLHPGLVGFFGIGCGQIGSRSARQRRAKGVAGRPPYLSGQAVAKAAADRLNC
jgi:hypothetical protein